MGVNLDISVVVATYNRSATLRETLAHLQAQSLAPERYEVIVVDDGSPDDTRQVVEAFGRHCTFALRYLHHANRGPGYTQNEGVRVAKAPLVLLIADDIHLEPESLEAHVAAHAADPSPGLACLGRVLQSPKLKQTVFLEKWDPWHIGALADGTVLPYHMFWACHISVVRDFMLEHGMFNEEKGRGGYAAHEDVELGYRMHLHGMKVVFCRRALGYHYHVETLEKELKRSYSRGVNFFDLRLRAPEPEIDITYRAYDLGSLFAMRRDLAGPRRDFLHEGDRSVVKLALRHLLRLAVFNRGAVSLLWLPLFAAAERARFLAALVHENMYRGVFVHYFRRGYADAVRQYGPQAQSRPA